MNTPERSRGNILIVDDKPENLAVLSDLLVQAGFKVRPAIQNLHV
jgi:CheY-like chemotaxis protein